MRWFRLVAAAVLMSAHPVVAADWLTAPSYYTHDWSSGHRVAQYSPIGPFYYYARQDFQKSGYRQLRSTLDLGNSSDNMHIVEQWGAQIVPYEQWRFPYRPYSVPYQDWGPPFGGLGGGTGLFPYSGGLGSNFFGGFFPPFGFGPGFGPGGNSINQSGPGIGAFSAPGGGGGGGGPGPGPGGPGHGHGKFPGTFFPPAVNFAQPWLDGHYPSYDLNDRSDYWRPYTTRPGRP